MVTDIPHRRRAGAAAVGAAALLWGLWPYWVRRGPGGGASATVGLAVGAILSLPLAIAQRRSRAPSSDRPRRGALAWLGMALLGATDAANVWCYFRALAEGAVAPAALSHYLAPVLVALAAPLCLGEPRSRRTLPALSLALAGTAVLVLLGRGDTARADAAFTHGLTLGAASAVFYAANVLLTKRLGPYFSDGELLSYHSVVTAALLLLGSGVPRAAPDLVWPAVGGVVSTMVAGLLYYAGLRRMPAEQAGVLTYLEPLSAVLVGWVLLGETPTVAAAAGGALILAGGLYVVTAPVERDGAQPSCVPDC